MAVAALQLATVDAILLYEMRDENTGAGDCGSTFGIKRTDGTQKAAYGEVMRALSEAPSSPSPAVVSWGINRIDAFMPGEYSNLRHLAWNGSTWFGWESLGGPLTSLPALASRGRNRIHAFYRGRDIRRRLIAWHGSTPTR